MKPSRRNSWLGLAVLMVTMGGAYFSQMQAQVQSAEAFTERNSSSGPLWTVQVDKVDANEVNLEPAFQIAIYESLLKELNKTKQFKEVVRDGDRKASDISDLLVLKTVVAKYTAGSETKRAVTTISGATKLTVHSQLCTRDGKTIVERTVDGNVRFMGSNLKATQNLARNVAKTIKKSSLPTPSQSVSQQDGQSSVSSSSAVR
ncbi:MAG TPA: hypothetical protein VG498_19105 [Terriglobales bacterium]|nr:hypothetical protein [Terriglobales bacterium]